MQGEVPGTSTLLVGICERNTSHVIGEVGSRKAHIPEQNKDIMLGNIVDLVWRQIKTLRSTHCKPNSELHIIQLTVS